MDERLRFILESIWRGRGIRGAKKDFSGLRKEAKKTLTALKNIGAGAAAMGVTFKKAFDFAKEGADMDLAMRRFERLGRELDLSSTFIDRMQVATGGMRTEFELMRSASELMSLGLVKNQDELERLMTVSGELGFDMNQLVLTLTNMTTMRFDALGVSVDGFDQKVKDLENTGMSAAQAFREAFLQQAEEQVGRLGSMTETSAGKIAAFEAQIRSVRDEVKLFLAEGLTPWMEIMTRDPELGMAPLEIALLDFLNTLGGAPDHIENYIAAVNKALDPTDEYRDRMLDLRNTADEAGDAIGEGVRGGVEDALSALSDFGTEAIGIQAVNQALTEAMAEGGISPEEQQRIERVAEVMGVDIPEGVQEGIGTFNELVAQGIDPATASTDELVAAAMRYRGELDKLDGRIVDVFINQIGGTGPAIPVTTSVERRQRGGSFVVPPGFPQDSFPLQVSSGERVTVEPSQSVRHDNRFSGMQVNINNQLDLRSFERLMDQWAGL